MATLEEAPQQELSPYGGGEKEARCLAGEQEVH